MTPSVNSGFNTVQQFLRALVACWPEWHRFCPAPRSLLHISCGEPRALGDKCCRLRGEDLGPCYVALRDGGVREFSCVPPR